MKKGLIGVIVLSIIGILFVVTVGAGIYFYNYYVFKEIRVCVGNWQNTRMPCDTRESCLESFNITTDSVEGAPEFVRENFERILDSAVYCNATCYVGHVRGVNYETGEIEGLKRCEKGEDEFLMEIRGKEGLAILNWMKNKK